MKRFLGHRYAIATGVGALALLVYVLTAYKGIGGRFMPVDSAGHQYYGRVVGPFNSAWHPLYYTITWLWERMRLVSTRSEQITLLSGVCGALTCGLLYLLNFRLTANRLASAVGALSLGFGVAYWTQATDAEVYTMQSACTVGTFLALLAWRDRNRSIWYLVACFLYAQSFGVHLMMGLLLPSFAYLVFSTDPHIVKRPALTMLVGLFIALGLMQYVGGYLQDWNAEHLAWGVDAERTLDGYIWTVMGDHWTGAMFAYSASEMLLDRVPFFLWLWNLQISIVGIGLSLFGIPILWRRDRQTAIALLAAALLTAVYSISYDVLDTDVFLLPVWVMLAPAVAAAMAWLLDWSDGRSRVLRFVMRTAPVAWLAGLVWLQAPAMVMDHNVFDPIRRLLEHLEPGALFVNPGQAWEETMVLRNFFFNEPRLFQRLHYIESVEEVPPGKRKHLGDPDVEIPRALERGAPIWVSQTDLSAYASCPLVRIENTLEDVIARMDPYDLVAIVWQNEGRLDDEPTRRALARLHLSGDLVQPRPRSYVGIGCLPGGCKGIEKTTRDLSRPLWAEARAGQELGGGARIPVDIRTGIVRGGFATDGKIEVDGADALLPQRRVQSVGYPKRRSGTTHIMHSVLSHQRTITGSAAVVIDGATGEIKARYYTDRGALAFDHKISVCRLEHKETFDAGGSIDFGDMSARAYLGTGFWVDAFDGERSAVSSHGSASNVFIPMKRPEQAYRLRLVVRSMFDDTTQKMTLTVNGVAAGTVALDKPGFQSYELPVPEGALKPGVNQIHFAYSRPRTPLEASGGFAVDRRILAVSLDRLDILPVSSRARVTPGSLLQRAVLARGFGAPEWMGQIAAAWSGGKGAVELWHARTTAPTMLRFLARPHEAAEPQVVHVALNGHPLPDVALAHGWTAYAIPVPSDLLADGKNLVELTYAREATGPSADEVDIAAGAPHRHMAVAFERFELSSGLDDDGRLEPGAIALYGTGFATPEANPTESWIWAVAREARLRLPMIHPTGSYTLALRARGAGVEPQTVDVVLNGKPAGRITLGPGFADHKVDLGALKTGENDLRFRFAYQVPPSAGDSRPLAASFQLLELTRSR